MCCAARGHALAVWHRLALPSPLRSDRSAAKLAPRRATKHKQKLQPLILTNKNLVRQTQINVFYVLNF